MLAHAQDALSKQFEIVDALDVRDDLVGIVKKALTDQKLKLMDG